MILFSVAINLTMLISVTIHMRTLPGSVFWIILYTTLLWDHRRHQWDVRWVPVSNCPLLFPCTGKSPQQHKSLPHVLRKYFAVFRYIWPYTIMPAPKTPCLHVGTTLFFLIIIFIQWKMYIYTKIKVYITHSGDEAWGLI